MTSVKNLFLLLPLIFFCICDNTNECEGLSSNQCNEYIRPSDEYTICIENENGDGCHLKACEDETNIDECWNYPMKGEKQCIINEDNNGCEYKSCDELSSSSLNCNDFIFPNEEDYEKICIDNGKGGCETKSCSTYDGDCADLKLNHELKCVGEKGNCSPQLKDCSDYNPDECTRYIYGDTTNYKVEKKCITNDLNAGCELRSCESLSNANCHKFNQINFNDEKCIEDENSDHCKIIACKDFKSNECNQFGDLDEFGDKKCLPDGEGGCTLKSCYDMNPDECQNFEITHSKCIKSGDFCEMIPKDCEELDVNNCDQYRPYSSEDKGKKCKLSKDKTKCQLTNQSGTIFSYFYILLFLLLV